jgi:hypothetical protein
MPQRELQEELAFVKQVTGQDDASILGAAVRRGVHSMYREALALSYLQGRIAREVLVQECGPEYVDRVDRERKAIDEDVAWGTSG